jgi:DNA invertase Pin-like site-specific DNA recombinase
MAQVYHHQESTQRQYALKDRALELGWPPDQIRVLDADLGQSGTQMNNRQDFKTLVADVSLEKVGAVFALEASRLSRSCSDWHRLLEICSLTGTLIVDADGCYDPADFNDQLLLGLKGTMSQAELHFIRARLQGGKRNKAQRGELRFPLPVGLVYGDEPGSILLDPDIEVQNAVRLVFAIFRPTGSAYGVVAYFAERNLPSTPAASFALIFSAVFTSIPPLPVPHASSVPNTTGSDGRIIRDLLKTHVCRGQKMLFVGPPGCGKTLVASLVATALCVATRHRPA